MPGYASQPLLHHDRDLETGGSGSPRNFAEIIQSDPEGAISTIQQDATVLPLLEEGAILTLGDSDMEDGDWQQMWRCELGKDNKPTSGWSATIEVEAAVVVIRNAAGADDQGLINPILKRYLGGACSLNVWGIEAVEAVLDFKWRTWAKHLLWAELGAYVIWLAAFQVFVLLFQDEDTDTNLRQLAHTRTGQVTLLADGFALAGMLPFVYIEAVTFVEYGPTRWLNIWNAMDLVAYVLQVAIIIMHVGRYALRSEELSTMVAVQALLLWVKMQYFLRVLQPTKNPFMDTLRAVIADVKWFLLLLVLTVWGFTCSFYILFRRDQQYEQYSTIGHAFLSTFSMLIGGADLDLFYSSHNPVVGVILMCLFVFTMSMVLLNCLIAIMSDACTRVAEKGNLRFLASRAQIIDELESVMPERLQRRYPEWHPAYVHILKAVPSSANSVFIKDDHEAQKPAPDPMEELQGTVTDLKAQVEVMAAFQRAMAEKICGPDAVNQLEKDSRSKMVDDDK